MATTRVTVRTAEGVWQDEVDSWTALVILAALSAEPESPGELAEAVRRYQPEHQLFDGLRRTSECDEVASDGSWCLIDLTGRTVVAGEEFELPDPGDAYEPNPDEQVEGFPIVWLDTPGDWLFQEAGDDWRQLVEARAAARAANPRVDARPVLLGEPFLGHLADGVLAARTEAGVDENRRQELTRAIHAQWLMTVRDDLGGRTPRQVLLAERTRIASDMEHRAHQWSRQGHAPPALPRDSAAYRLGGFGTIEVVFYFDLARALLAEAWESTARGKRPTKQVLVERLAEFRDRWLSEPNEETGPLLPPAQWIESERQRMPVTSDGSHADDDCPLCQAEADGVFGVGFIWFDGHHLELEDEFAFSLCETREQWDEQQEEYRKFSEEMDRQERERASAGGESAGPLEDPVWQASYVDPEALAGPNATSGLALLTLGFPLAELIGGLRQRANGDEFVQSLNQAYSDLRGSQDRFARDSAAQEFRERLEQVTGTFPDLTPKCADLQSRLDEALRRLD